MLHDFIYEELARDALADKTALHIGHYDYDGIDGSVSYIFL
jgi:hypothetical protein